MPVQPQMITRGYAALVQHLLRTYGLLFFWRVFTVWFKLASSFLASPMTRFASWHVPHSVCSLFGSHHIGARRQLFFPALLSYTLSLCMCMYARPPCRKGCHMMFLRSHANGRRYNPHCLTIAIVVQPSWLTPQRLAAPHDCKFATLKVAEVQTCKPAKVAICRV